MTDAAVAVLWDPAPHAGRTYELTGPQAHTLTQVATSLTAVTGHTITYQPETVEEGYASRRANYCCACRRDDCVFPALLFDATVGERCAVT